MKTRLFFLPLLLLLGSLFLAPALPAHAQSTGVVCIIPSGASSCPSSPATIGGTVGSQLRVSVFIQNSSGLNGFDIALLADHTILKPAGFDLTGTVLQGPQQVVVYCQGGVLVQGAACSSTDTVDTLHLAAVNCVGCGITATPTTGLLFTAVYNVTAATGGIPLQFQTGCSNSSVSPNVCVTIVNGTPTPVPETVQTATFTTGTIGDFTIAASPSSLTMTRSSTSTSTITLTSVAFAGTINLSTVLAPLTGHSPGTTLSSTSVALSSGGSTSVTLTVSTSKNAGFGTYTITVTGTSGTLSHSVTVTATVTH